MQKAGVQPEDNKSSANGDAELNAQLAKIQVTAKGSDLTILDPSSEVARITAWKEVTPLELKVTISNECASNQKASFDT